MGSSIRKFISVILIITNLVTSVFFIPAVFAADPVAPNMFCGEDKNGNGYLGDEGEYQSCLISTIPHSVDASASCLPGYTLEPNGACMRYEYAALGTSCPSGYLVQNGRCIKQSQVNPTSSCPAGTSAGTYNNAPACGWVWTNGWPNYSTPSNPVIGAAPTTAPGVSIAFVRPQFTCPVGTLSNGKCLVNQDAGPVQAVCQTGYVIQNNQCVKSSKSDTVFSCTQGTLNGTKCDWNTTGNYCPLSVDQTCLNNGGGASCSPNKCVDIVQNKPVDEGKIDGTMLVNDGKRSEDGVCLDQILIFSGRAQDCKLSGVDTAFKNCCKSEGKVFTDSAGALGNVTTAVSTISKVYDASQEAYTYYTVAMQATGDTAVASSMAAQGFGNSMILAFDPTTLAISIAIYFAMQYLMKACDQTSMETAMQAGSGYCHEVGTYCKKKVPLLGCVQKATSYCCFNSKLARIIHEQGRPQLVNFNGWGDTESPQCRGFTPDEFSAIDFAKIDLTEYVEDMVKKATSEIQSNVNQITQDFYEKTN